MLSPRELKRGVFSKALKGYSAAEVDEYIHFLLSKYAEAYNEYLELERKYAEVVEQLNDAKSEENAISTTIVNAQKMADAIVTDAKEKAVGIKNAVSDSCDNILDSYMAKVTAERDKLAECEAAVLEFKTALLNAYKKHLDLINDIMPDEEPTPYLSDEELEDMAVDAANEKIAEITGVSYEASSDENEESVCEQQSENDEEVNEESDAISDEEKAE